MRYIPLKHKKPIEELLEYANSLKRLGAVKKHQNYQVLIEITSFLQENCSVSQRIWHVKNERWDIPKCIQCKNKDAIWDKERGGRYRLVCSQKCSSNSDDVKNKTAKTNLERYGDSCVLNNKKIRSKMLKKIKDKYGVDHISQCQAVKDKKRQTSLNNYGVSHPLQSKVVKDKIQQTNLEKYGHTNVLVSEYGKQKTLDTNLKKYNDTTHARDFNIREKTKKTNIEKYGFASTAQNKEIRKKQIQTKIERYGKIGISNLSSDILQKLNDYDWMYNQYITNQLPSEKIAEILSCSPQSVLNYLHRLDIDIVSNPTSYGEREIVNWLKSILPEDDIKTNTRKLISPYEVDIFLPNYNIAIEYCGLYWHSETRGKDKWYHYNKWSLCLSKDVTLLTIFEDEWQNHQDIIKNTILHKLGLYNEKRVYGRKTVARQISNEERDNFLNKYHILQTRGSTFSCGLFYKDELVAVLLANKRNSSDWEITRYATSLNILGGFSKLESFFTHVCKPSRIITFSDSRWGIGNMYKETGYVLDKQLPPDYYYSLDGHKRSHKFNFRRKHLPKLLEYFDPSKSEQENCNYNKVLRIWDCGKFRWIKQV